MNEHAYHLEPTDDPDVRIRIRLFVGSDGGVYHDKIRVQHEETLEVLQRDKPTEDTTSKIIRD